MVPTSSLAVIRPQVQTPMIALPWPFEKHTKDDRVVIAVVPSARSGRRRVSNPLNPLIAPTNDPNDSRARTKIYRRQLHSRVTKLPHPRTIAGPSKLPERPRRVSLTRLIAQFSPPDSFIAGFGSLLSVTRRVHPTRLHQAPDRYEAQFSFCKKLSTRGRPRRRVRAFPGSKAEARQGVFPAHDQHAPCTLRAVSLGLENKNGGCRIWAIGQPRESALARFTNIFNHSIYNHQKATMLL